MKYQEEVLRLMRDVLNKGINTVEMVSSGNSMAPLIKIGDILTVCQVNFQNIFPGDIAVFDSGGKLCAHRLMNKYAVNGLHWLRTKPDICFAADSPVKESCLLGKVTAIKKNKLLIKLDKFPWYIVNFALSGLHLCVFYLKIKLRPALISIGMIS